MRINFKQIVKTKHWDYFILVSRFLLAIVFLNYGIAKITGHQFGISEDELLIPIRDLSLFKVSWYLFDHQPFKFIVGISQIICAALLFINRTVLLGAFMFLPIIFTILIMDISFMPTELVAGFTWRLSSYILLDIFILFHYKEKMNIIWESIWNNVNTKFKHSLKAYLLLPVFSIILGILLAMPRAIISFLMQPLETLNQILEIFN